jgi:hypothetical protein
MPTTVKADIGKRGSCSLISSRSWRWTTTRRMHPMRANVFAANARVLLLLESCFELEENTIMGMDLIDGELNMEVNAAIERYSQMTTLCGVGSQLPGNEDEPLFLVRDTRLHDTVVELYWMPDDDDDDNGTETPEVPAAHRHRQPVPVLL